MKHSFVANSASSMQSTKSPSPKVQKSKPDYPQFAKPVVQSQNTSEMESRIYGKNQNRTFWSNQEQERKYEGGPVRDFTSWSSNNQRQRVVMAGGAASGMGLPTSSQRLPSARDSQYPYARPAHVAATHSHSQFYPSADHNQSSKH